MEYGLSPPGRIKSRRNREMVKKQVRTMATAEKIASDSDWYISLWTANAKVWVIQSAGCLGQKEVVTASHNACIRELLQEVNVHGKADRHIRFLTIETESRLGTLWDQEECIINFARRKSRGKQRERKK